VAYAGLHVLEQRRPVSGDVRLPALDLGRSRATATSGGYDRCRRAASAACDRAHRSSSPAVARARNTCWRNFSSARCRSIPTWFGIVIQQLTQLLDCCVVDEVSLGHRRPVRRRRLKVLTQVRGRLVIRERVPQPAGQIVAVAFG
jgi:hypothetical protein